MWDESGRAAALLAAQDRALTLFDEVRRRGIIAAGRRESAVSDAIRDLAAARFGVARHWHKRIVRAGPNTLHPYRENPPDRVIDADDIVFCDFGPLFDEWEADIGRTYVLGDDPVKHRLCADLPAVFDAARQRFAADPQITGEQLFAAVRELTAARGWEFGGPHAGHLVGEFPHERIAGDQVENYITTGSRRPMRRDDRSGRRCHWILEIHLVDRERSFGGFYEQLLDLG
ncbi:MAG TPA: M24 family metallopeptidase [Pilimelia sp.]|nr:M24 family metallopeptidase [Pilimelia sp.]